MLSASSGVDRLLAPRHGTGVCRRCLNLTAEATGCAVRVGQASTTSRRSCRSPTASAASGFTS